MIDRIKKTLLALGVEVTSLNEARGSNLKMRAWMTADTLRSTRAGREPDNHGCGVDGGEDGAATSDSRSERLERVSWQFAGGTNTSVDGHWFS